MKIRNIHCDSFAALHDRDVELGDGVNILEGENEAGKTTLSHLVYSLLFQGVDKSSGKEMDSFFPVSSAQGKDRGNFISGSMRFCTEEGTYEVKKSWRRGKDGQILLRLPSGGILEGKEAEEKMKELVPYGEGIGRHILFSSQQDMEDTVRPLLSGKDERWMTDIRSFVTGAAARTGGISLEEFEKELAERIEEYEKNWDTERNEPVRKKGKDPHEKRVKDVGRILGSYYAYEGLKECRDDAVKMDRAYDERYRAEAEYREFLKYSPLLRQRQRAEEYLGHLSEEREKEKKELSGWPQREESLEKGEELKRRKEKAEFLSAWDRWVLAGGEEREEPVRGEDVEEARGKEEKIRESEGLLRGMKLTADVRLHGGYAAEKTVLSDGKTEELKDGTFDVTESLRIRVKDVIDLTLAPKGVDAEKTGEALRRDRSRLAEILGKYSAGSAGELERKYRAQQEKARELEQRKEELLEKYAVYKKAENPGLEEVRAAASGMRDSRKDPQEIEKEVRALCGGADLEIFIDRARTEIARLKKEYGSVQDLERQIRQTEEKIRKERASLEQAEKLPEEYRSCDPDQKERQLQERSESAGRKYEECARQYRQDLAQAQRYVADPLEGEVDEDAVRKAGQAYRDTLEEYRRYLDIREAYEEVRREMMEHPYADIAESFRKYLGIVSGGSDALEEFDEEGMKSVRILGKGNGLDEKILSAGTCQTIALAFRLAMLEHVFPRGGGIALFDDPFTDMDPARREQAWALVEQFARDNQVLFVTCDNVYDSLSRHRTIRL